MNNWVSSSTANINAIEAEGQSVETKEKATEISEQADKIENATTEHSAESFIDKTKSEAKADETSEKLKDTLTEGVSNSPDAKEEKELRYKRSDMKRVFERYTKIKAFSEKNKSEKLNKELEAVKKELENAKKNYESAKNYFLGKTDFAPEKLKTIKSSLVRYKVREGKLFNAPSLKMSTYRRNITINTIITKINKIIEKGGDPKEMIRLVMGFDKPRILRYTGAKIVGGMDKLGGAMGLQMDPQQFHQFFNVGKKNILAVIDKGDQTTEEKETIKAIKDTIDYFGYTYARQRATAWTDPFLEAEKAAKEEGRLIKMEAPKKFAKAD